MEKIVLRIVQGRTIWPCFILLPESVQENETHKIVCDFKIKKGPLNPGLLTKPTVN